MKNFLFIALIGLSLTACKKQSGTSTDTTSARTLTVKTSLMQSGTTYSFSVINQNKTSVLSVTNKSENTTYTATVTKGDVLSVSYSITTPGQPVGVGEVDFNIEGLPKVSGANGSSTGTIIVN